ncbi:MAG: 1-acyl-sn-glycerol-3-phosphate acyltransferase [Bacteroidales bacterium]|nr:1-acyl-sn-glycerol-3-phosphate acyltransferase [Bacteroidales bacterium]
MIIINLIQFLLLAIWLVLFCYVITLLLPSKVTLWLAVYLWSPVTIFLTLSRIKVEGLENIDSDKHYIFMANHASFLDIPALMWGTKRALHFMAKEELNRNILTGYTCRKMRMIFIDRGNSQKTTSNMRVAKELIAEGEDIALCPEGTRTKTGELGPFKRGGFKFAIASQVDIVPVTIKNSAVAWSRDNIHFHPTTVVVHIGKPVSVQGLQETDAGKVSAQVFDIIKEELKN